MAKTDEIVSSLCFYVVISMITVRYGQFVAHSGPLWQLVISHTAHNFYHAVNKHIESNSGSA